MLIRTALILKNLLLLIAVAMCAMPLGAVANDKVTPNQPTMVDVGLFLNSIPAVMLKERKFQADMNIWFQWEGDAINPMDAFSIVDGLIDSKEELQRNQNGKLNYGLYRVVSTIHYNFDLSKYPLDDHALKIQIEDKRWGSDKMLYRVDTANSKISNRVHVPGWRVGNFETASLLEPVTSNFGDTSRRVSEGVATSKAVFTLAMHRNGYGNFFKLFSMLFFACGLSFFSFRVRADHIDARLALIVSGIFMAAITASMIASSLPESDKLDMAEMLYFEAMAFIFSTCLLSLHTFKLFTRGDENQANKISKYSGIILPIIFVIVTTLIINLYHGEI